MLVKKFFSKRLAEESGEAVYQINVFGPESPNSQLDTSSFLPSWINLPFLRDNGNFFCHLCVHFIYICIFAHAICEKCSKLSTLRKEKLKSNRNKYILLVILSLAL